MGNMERTELSRCNRFAMICHTVVVIIICVAYATEILKGARTPLYVGIIAVIGLIPVLMEWSLYKRDKEAHAIMHVIGIGFMVFYAILLFTAQNALVFTYVILIILAVSVFCDMKFSIIMSGCILIMNLVQAGLGIATKGFGYSNMASVEIQVLLILIVCIESIGVTLVLKNNSAARMAELEEERGKTQNILDNVLKVSESMGIGIREIYDQVDQLSQTAIVTQQAMGQVNDGSAETAQAVQRQLTETENIRKKIKMVAKASDQISEYANHTNQVIREGQDVLNTLVEQVNNSVEDGKAITNKLSDLDEYIGQMNSIVELINDVTEQTGLLSLNASIEAARAGEAGKGFAVVASEINSMASKTSEATEDITTLIHNVGSSIEEVVKSVRCMISTIDKENQMTENTVASFQQISENASEIHQSTNSLTKSVDELNQANEAIMTSIQTISGVSDEVSRHASQTVDYERDNAGILRDVSAKTQNLKQLAEQL